MTSGPPHKAVYSCPRPACFAAMVIVRFEDTEIEKRALGFMAGRFSFRSWSTGEFLVSEDVLPYLAREGLRFTLEGPARYEQNLPALRTAAPAAV